MVVNVRSMLAARPQVITSYTDDQLPLVLQLVNRMANHLTAGIVSNDQHFLNEVLGNTISGTIYAGIRARTTAAPQQHWYGRRSDLPSHTSNPPPPSPSTHLPPPSLCRQVWPLGRSTLRGNPYPRGHQALLELPPRGHLRLRARLQGVGRQDQLSRTTRASARAHTPARPHCHTPFPWRPARVEAAGKARS